MSLITNENGTLKQLDVSQYQSAHFIDDSLFQDLTLAELGFTEDMVFTYADVSAVVSDIGAGTSLLRPLKSYVFDFTPKMVRVMQYPADQYMKKLTDSAGAFIDNPLQEYYDDLYSTQNTGYYRTLQDHCECSTMFFQANSLGSSMKPGSTDYRDALAIYIGGKYGYCCVGPGPFCGDAGNMDGSEARDIGTGYVWFGGMLHGNQFTLYAWVYNNRSSKYTTADVLNSRWMYGQISRYSNYMKSPIFEFQVVGG